MLRVEAVLEDWRIVSKCSSAKLRRRIARRYGPVLQRAELTVVGLICCPKRRPELGELAGPYQVVQMLQHRNDEDQRLVVRLDVVEDFLFRSAPIPR